MKNKFLKVFLLGFCLFSFFLFNKVVLFPFVYEKLYTFELKKSDQVFSIFKNMSGLKISDLYHQAKYLFENGKESTVSKSFHLTSRHLFLPIGDDSVDRIQEMTWVFYPQYEVLEAMDILLNNGVTALEFMSFAKYKLGIPFFIKDELNILWDIYFNKNIYLNTLKKSDNRNLFHLRISESKFRDMNTKYLLLLTDLFERQEHEVSLSLGSNVPIYYKDFVKSLASNSKYLSYKETEE